EGTLLVLVAMQLGSRLSRHNGVIWIVAQTLLLAAAITIHWSARPALLLTPPYFGFQILAFFTFESMSQLTIANNELRALHETLVSGVPRPCVHLQIADDVRIDDPERGHILIRAVQEIVTNAARHANAENLWIVIERAGNELRIRAHDDGRGSDNTSHGFGLR